ncbi:MAG: hypothetical protein CMO80_06740 [Verrucomicrobiales bacterium]|nr:hypothetical protein [Verrucomicrobiales bacterium]|tara:strand:+ start:4406 stop:4708 length:303 start_codon:yes stop_codon:yes gene_type:complete
MVCKFITVTVTPGYREDFLSRQRIWNEAMSRQPGFVDVSIATDPTRPDRICILIQFDSHADLDRFMNDVHDDLAEQTKISETYSAIEVKILNVIETVKPC